MTYNVLTGTLNPTHSLFHFSVLVVSAKQSLSMQSYIKHKYQLHLSKSSAGITNNVHDTSMWNSVLQFSIFFRYFKCTENGTMYQQIVSAPNNKLLHRKNIDGRQTCTGSVVGPFQYLGLESA